MILSQLSPCGTEVVKEADVSVASATLILPVNNIVLMEGVDLVTPAVVVVVSLPNFVKPPITTFSVVEVIPLTDVQEEVPPPPEAVFPKITFPEASTDNTLVGVVAADDEEFKFVNFNPLVPADGDVTVRPGLMVIGCWAIAEKQKFIKRINKNIFFMSKVLLLFDGSKLQTLSSFFGVTP